MLLGGDLLSSTLHLLDGSVNGLLDAATDGDGVSASGNVAQALVDDDLSQQRGGGGAVTNGVVGLGGDLLHELSAHVLDGVLELDLLSDGDAVVGDGGSAVGTLQGNVAALGAKRGGNSVSERVDALGKTRASVGTKDNVLSHDLFLQR